jgi:hypothetical protein
MSNPKEVDRPMQSLSIDLIGPLPKSKEGYMHILSVVDVFSKYVWLHPLRRATATPIIKFIEREIFLKHGVPSSILSDNGRQFISKEFKAFIKKYSIPKLFLNAVYSPQSNTVERYNQTVGTSLAILVGKDQRLWSQYLQSVQTAINASVNLATKYSPFFLMHGREIILDGRFHLPKDYLKAKDAVLPAAADCAQYADRIQNLPFVFEIVQAQLLKNFQSNARSYNLRRKDTQLVVGQRVWRKNFILSDAANYFSTKLAQRYVENIVLTKISPLVYELGDLNGNSLGRFHIKDIAKY